MWLVLALASAILTAISAIVEKKTLFSEHAMEFSSVLAIFNLIISLPLLATADFNLPTKIWLLIILVSFMAAVAFLLFAKALRHSEVSVSSALMNFRPLFVFILAFIFLKERLAYYQMMGIMLLILGAYVLEMHRKKEPLIAPFRAIFRSKYSHYIFLSITLYAITSVLDKYVLLYTNPSTYLFLAHLFIAIFFMIFITLYHNGLEGIRHGIESSWKTIAVVALLTTSYRFMQTIAVSEANVSLVSPIKQTSAFFATLLGGTLFHEKHLVHKLIAVTIMIIGAVMII